MVELLACSSKACVHGTLQHFDRSTIDDRTWLTVRHVPFYVLEPSCCILWGFEMTGVAVAVVRCGSRCSCCSCSCSCGIVSLKRMFCAFWECRSSAIPLHTSDIGLQLHTSTLPSARLHTPVSCFSCCLWWVFLLQGPRTFW